MINNGFNDLEDELNNAIKEKCDKSYNKGLEDAWDLAHRLNNMTLDEVHKIYGFSIHREEVFSAVDAQEALAKIEAYEKKQNEIKVGDVVFGDDEPDVYGIVTFVSCEMIYIVWSDGSSGVEYDFRDIKKTGKHIDITSVLEQLRGE